MTNSSNGQKTTVLEPPVVEAPALFKQPNGWQILAAHHELTTLTPQEISDQGILHAHDALRGRVSRLLESSYGIGEGTVIALEPRMDDDHIGHGLETGQECFIDAGVSVGFKTVLGDRVTLAEGVSIGHDVFIGDDVYVERDNVIPADVVVESGTKIPAGMFPEGALRSNVIIDTNLSSRARPVDLTL